MEELRLSVLEAGFAGQGVQLRLLGAAAPHDAVPLVRQVRPIDVWDIPPESATRVGHPAPFPVELPQRLIELLTYRDDLVLDPFMGSGSTIAAAEAKGLTAIGCERYLDYYEVSRKAIPLLAKLPVLIEQESLEF